MSVKPFLCVIFCLLFLHGAAFPQEKGIYDITSFGAVGDGTTLNTESIQKTIDACAADGGGIVLVPRGKFLAGSLFLKSHVTLCLSQNAVLLASPDAKDYSAPDFCPQNRAFAGDFVKGGHFINAVEQTNVKITGEGTINGNGESFLKDPKTGKLRPKHLVPWRPGQMLFFCECSDVVVENVLLTNSPYWTSFYHGCVDVRINNVKIRNALDAANADGIDIDCCKNVLISDCNIETCDDAITLRASSNPLKNKRPCENIVVTNCVLRSACQAIRVGVGDGLIRNAVFSNLVIHQTNVGLNFHSSYGASSPGVSIDNIRFQNITMDVTKPFHITYGFATKDRKISNIYFDNISGTARVPGQFLGQNEMPIQNVHLTNIDLRLPEGNKMEQVYEAQNTEVITE